MFGNVELLGRQALGKALLRFDLRAFGRGMLERSFVIVRQQATREDFEADTSRIRKKEESMSRSFSML